MILEGFVEGREVLQILDGPVTFDRVHQDHDRLRRVIRNRDGQLGFAGFLVSFPVLES